MNNITIATTPGPYIVENVKVDGKIHIGVVRADDPLKVVALTGYCGAPDESESLANAAMFAAAPHAIEALIVISELLNKSKNVIDLEKINNVISQVFEKVHAEAGG